MKLDCRHVQQLAGAFAEDELDDRDLSSVLSHIRTCSSCYEELKTAYLISYAIQYMDHDRSGSLDIDTLMKDKIRKCELRLRRNRIFGALLWIAIVLLAVVIAAVIIRILSPEMVPWLGDFIGQMLKYLGLPAGG